MTSVRAAVISRGGSARQRLTSDMVYGLKPIGSVRAENVFSAQLVRAASSASLTLALRAPGTCTRKARPAAVRWNWPRVSIIVGTPKRGVPLPSIWWQPAQCNRYKLRARCGVTAVARAVWLRSATGGAATACNAGKHKLSSSTATTARGGRRTRITLPAPACAALGAPLRKAFWRAMRRPRRRSPLLPPPARLSPPPDRPQARRFPRRRGDSGSALPR